MTYLLRHKWRTFGRWFYYSKLLVYAIYLIFLTAYALTIIADEYEFTYPIDNFTHEQVRQLLHFNTPFVPHLLREPGTLENYPHEYDFFSNLKMGHESVGSAKQNGIPL